MYDLMKSVYDRWVAAGLNTSVAELYPAGEGRGTQNNRSGTPPATALPRAEYMLADPPPQIKTRNSRTNQAVAVIRVWGTHSASLGADAVVANFVQDIKDAFVNADESGMTMENGDILEVDDGGSACVKDDDHIWMGTVTLLIRNRRNNRAP